MTTNPWPRVSVVIPVYNGEQMLAEAIRSVQAQTYPNWDLTVGNNQSTDRTAAIVEEIAARDPRIRLVTYPKHVGVVDSHNHSLTLHAPDAKYIKILGADDWFFPQCLEELVKVAEAYPTVGMVCSYVLAGAKVRFDGLPYPSPFTPGREIGRKRLLNNVRVLGSPSTSLLRISALEGRHPFYNPLNYAGDAEAYLGLLKQYDFGYVHQVLTFVRTGEKSRTTHYLERVGSYFSGDLDELTKFGPHYLTADEFKRRLKEVTDTYYRFLAFQALHFPGQEFWDYHFKHLRAMGYRVNRWRLARYVAARVVDMLLNPKRTVEGLVERFAATVRPTVRPASAPTAAADPVVH